MFLETLDPNTGTMVIYGPRNLGNTGFSNHIPLESWDLET